MSRYALYFLVLLFTFGAVQSSAQAAQLAKPAPTRTREAAETAVAPGPLATILSDLTSLSESHVDG